MSRATPPTYGPVRRPTGPDRVLPAHRGHWYAGRFDLIADIGPDRWMLDAKTGSGIYPEAAVQTDAYRCAEFYVTDDDRTPSTRCPKASPASVRSTSPTPERR